MPRLFTGLEIPREVADALSLLRGGLPGARWIDPENYHITLRFIGDIDDRLAHEIACLLDGMRRRRFEVRFGGPLPEDRTPAVATLRRRTVPCRRSARASPGSGADRAPARSHGASARPWHAASSRGARARERTRIAR